MMDEELERFEAELRRVTPASPPAEMMERLRAAQVRPRPVEQPRPSGIAGFAVLFMRLRWLLAATPVVVAVVAFAWLKSRPEAGAGKISSAASPGIKANVVQVDHSLVSSYDAVVELPGGEPVRFHCRKWMDGVRLRDNSHGLVIEQSSPRVEVVPVRFETY